MSKPVVIVQAPFSGKWYLLRAYKVYTDGTLESTGKREDVTEQVELILEEKTSALRLRAEKLEGVLRYIANYEPPECDNDGRRTTYPEYMANIVTTVKQKAQEVLAKGGE